MSLLLNTHKPSQQGFTLVELAIVMVIIGLLIGGVLKGQELIANARVTGTVADLKNTDAALNGFQDKYAGLPGDILTPANRLSSCTVAPCNRAGDADSRIETVNNASDPSTFPAGASESNTAFAQLSAADMISGVNAANGATFGGAFPALKLGGGMWIAYANNAPVAGIVINRHYATLAGTTANTSAVNGILTGSQMAQIDRKLDDGRPLTGSVVTNGTNCFTGAGVAAVYDETGIGTCTGFMRVLN